MRHRRRNKRFGLVTEHRQAMMRNMVTSLLEHGKIVTTVPRAKEVRRLADRMVSLAKAGSLHARRQALMVIRSQQVVGKLFTHWGKEFADRSGGYTRIVRQGPRRGDAAEKAILEMAVEPLERVKGSGKTRKVVPAQAVIPQAVDVAKASEPEGGVAVSGEAAVPPESSSDGEVKPPSQERAKEEG